MSGHTFSVFVEEPELACGHGQLGYGKTYVPTFVREFLNSYNIPWNNYDKLYIFSQRVEELYFRKSN